MCRVIRPSLILILVTSLAVLAQVQLNARATTFCATRVSVVRKGFDPSRHLPNHLAAAQGDQCTLPVPDLPPIPSLISFSIKSSARTKLGH